MADQLPHQCCVVEPRCRLCQFQLADGDAVLVGGPSPPFPFRLRSSHTLGDGPAATTYHLCCRKDCTRRNSVAACFHQDCYAFKPSPLAPNFIPATHHDFTPDPAGELPRRRRLQRTLARKLGLGVMAGVPAELRYMVAEHLVRECAVISCQELTSLSHGSGAEVDLSRDVYATYVSFEGIHYVQSLDNNPRPSGGKAQLLFDSKQGHPLRNIYVAYDHLGIRDVYVETSENPLPPSVPATRGMWWRSLYKGHLPRALTAKSDGLKLRQLQDSTYGGQPSSNPGHGWAIPGPDRTLVDLQKGRIAPNVNASLRMSFLELNRPDTDGYAAAIEGFHLTKLVAHRRGADTSFYKTLDDSPNTVVWMYLPLNPGETVREISAIRLFTHFVALLLHTSEERAVLFGKYYLDYGPGFDLRHLCTMADAPAHLYFNERDPVHDALGINYLGVDEETTKLGASVAGPVRELRSRYPPPLIPSFPPPYSLKEPWHYTNCRMEGVQEITLCLETLECTSVIGMLLRYHDGRRACLGQYRLDWAAAPFVVDPSRRLRMGFARSPVLLTYVAVVTQDESVAEPEDTRWLEIPWQGRLEWWFAEGQCRLDYSDGGFSMRSKRLTPWV